MPFTGKVGGFAIVPNIAGRTLTGRALRTTRMNHYSCDADDFYVNVHLNTEMELPTNRDTVLHFFEQMKKGFPGPAQLLHARERRSCPRGRQGAGYPIAGWRSSLDRLCSGHTNPESLEDAYRQHELVLDLAPPLLDDQPAGLRGARRHVWLRLHLRRQSRRGGDRGTGGGSGLEGLLEFPARG